jgi:hypothetical protein
MNTRQNAFRSIDRLPPAEDLGRKQHYPERLRCIRFRDAETGKILVFLANNFDLPALTIAALYKNKWQKELFFKWIQAAPSDQAVLWNLGKRGQDPDMDRCVSLCARGDRQKAAPPGRVALHMM